MKMSFDMYTHWLKRWHCFINWKPQRHGTLFKTVPRAVDWVKSKQIYVWHGAIAQTEDNCTKWNSIITCKTTIATMTLPRLLLVHKHIPTMMLGSLLLWYTFIFFLSAHKFTGIVISFVYSLIESSIPCKRTFLLPWFGLVCLVLHHFLSLSFRNFRFSATSLRRASVQSVRAMHAFHTALNWMNIYFYISEQCFRSYVQWCARFMPRVQQSLQQRVMLMTMTMTTMVGGWVGIRKFVVFISHKIHGGILNLITTMQTRQCYSLEITLPPTKRTYNNVNVSISWRHFKFVSWAERTYLKARKTTVAHKRSGISVSLFTIYSFDVEHLNLSCFFLSVPIESPFLPLHVIAFWRFLSAFANVKVSTNATVQSAVETLE